MKFTCAACGYADVAGSQYELLRHGHRFFDPDDIDSDGLCFECRRSVTDHEWVTMQTRYFGQPQKSENQEGIGPEEV